MHSAAAGAAAAAAIQNAQAMGVIVRLDAEDFFNILLRSEEPLVVHSESKENFFSRRFQHFAQRRHKYLTSYKGLAFYATSPIALPIPEHVEIVEAKRIWVPGEAF